VNQNPVVVYIRLFPTKEFLMNRILAAMMFACLAFCPISVWSQPSQLPAAPLQASHRAELIREVSENLREVYVFEDVALEMIELINDKLERGEYDQFDTVAALTDQLTADLQSISHDLHLNVRAAKPPTRNAEGEGLSPQEQAQRRLEGARRQNFGFRRVEMLPGNIGYLELSYFEDADIGGDTAVAAMNFLANSSAIIFDLRNNRGGTPSMIQLISSYLFDEPQHLNSFYVRRTDNIEQFWTQARVQGPSMADIPVYILTSGRTFSAAEEFTYNLKNMERATVVGETTGGGAHPVDTLMLDLGDDHYARISLPFGRAINPITSTNWEGTGVTPNIETPTKQALAIAQFEILKALSAAATNEQSKFSYDWARDELNFQLNPTELQLDSAAAYVGQYGPRKIVLQDGKLSYQRGGGQEMLLSPMGKADNFHVGDSDTFRIQFEREANGDVTSLIGQYSSGRTDKNARNIEP
jgi:hypothetical protein